MSYSEGNLLESFLCMEVNFIYLFNNIDFLKIKNFDFGIVKYKELFDENYDYYGFIYSIVYNTNRKYNEIKTIFNSSEYTPENYVIKDDNFEYSFYYILYLETTKVLKEHPELKFNISDIENEYTNIMENITFQLTDTSSFVSEGIYNKTTCRKKIVSNEYECFIDEFKMSFTNYFTIKIDEKDENFFGINSMPIIEFPDLFIYSITYTYPEMNRRDMYMLIKIKLMRITLFFIFFTLVIFCFFILFINIFSEYSFQSIIYLTNNMEQITIIEGIGKINLLKLNKSFHPNNEMQNLDSIYQLLNNSFMITEIFENENFFKKNIVELSTLLDSIKKKNIKGICNTIFGIFYFINNLLSLAEDKFKSSLYFIKENERKLQLKGNYEYDKIKEEIKRSSNVPYLNEYSEFNNLDENMQDIIYINIYKQRFIYLYAMTKYKLANEINNDKNNKKRKKRELFERSY